MPYVTSFEKICIDKGMQAGEAAAPQKLLTKRFGAIPAVIQAQISTAKAEQ
jgi:hypothetical protein